MENLKTTPLFEAHVSLNAKMTGFGGWNMPIRYSSALEEHHFVREHCGLFDVSHMGEVRITGTEANDFVQYLTINDIKRLEDKSGQYTAILNESGGMIDDLILYRLEDNHYFLCVNAANTEKDFKWIVQQSQKFNVNVTNESSQWAQIAVQGPESQKALAAIFSDSYRQELDGLSYMKLMSVEWDGKEIFVARTGYTGEHGYELYIPADIAMNIWNALLELGSHWVRPIGLAARDTLRLEACYLLYGNDMDESVTPLEAGIGWATRLDSADFIGKNKLVLQKESGVPRKNIAFKMTDPGIPRAHMDIYRGDQKIGHVTSGSVLPSVGGSGGMAMVDKDAVKIEDDIYIDVRGKRKLAQVVKKPLYNPKVK